MRRGFEQESLHTLSKHATEFKNKVNLPKILSETAVSISALGKIDILSLKTGFKLSNYSSLRLESWLRMTKKGLRFMKVFKATKGKSRSVFVLSHFGGVGGFLVYNVPTGGNNNTLGARGLSCAVSGLGQCLYCDPRENQQVTKWAARNLWHPG